MATILFQDFFKLKRIETYSKLIVSHKINTNTTHAPVTLPTNYMYKNINTCNKCTISKYFRYI